MASRRAINPSRRVADSGSIPLVSSLHQKSRTSSLLPIGLVAVAAFLLIGYSLRGSGGFPGVNEAMSNGQGLSCSAEIIRAIPILKKAYGDSLRKVLHVGVDSCAVVSNLLKEKDTEAWGVEPFDLEDADSSCKSLVRKGFVRTADIKFPLPYRPKSFSLVVVSDSLDYLSLKYLNKTLPDIARVSSDGLVIFAGFPGQQRAKVSESAKFGKLAKLRSSSWWVRYFIQTGLEENEMAIKKFEQASSESSYKPSCQIFHLSSGMINL
ncbi:putative pectin methylesterase CGR2 [Curcuma longa]|uniref:putative pectin methylesterase CGR2 n=1 Tax=Curcuma longa TaxID=136217 RepID=UPI003D9E66F5